MSPTAERRSNGQLLRLTPKLRWLDRSPRYAAGPDIKVLQQAWIVQETGEEIWKDVPEESES